ncbi:MAG: NADH:flavin oxidoreductase [Coprobacillaceae bacterium]
MDKLNTPITIKKLKLKNRLVMPPMATSKSDAGKVTQELLTYYDEKSKGGYIGLIINEHSYINENGMASTNQVSISKDEDIEGMKQLVNVIHQNNTPVFAQINHAGSRNVGRIRMSASALKHPQAKEDEVLPIEMTIEDIQQVVKDFATAALRAKEAGFDGVEIHGAHGYLLNQFYSPLTNKRIDQYGGDILNRIRFHLEVIKEIRKAVGEEYPLALRLGTCDFIDGGNVLEDAIAASIAFEKAGIDVLDVTGGLKGYIRPGRNEEGYFSDISTAIKEKISIPVILTGGVKTANGVEELLKKNTADLIGVGRIILKDSDWAKKCIESGR